MPWPCVKPLRLASATLRAHAPRDGLAVDDGRPVMSPSLALALRRLRSRARERLRSPVDVRCALMRGFRRRPMSPASAATSSALAINAISAAFAWPSVGRGTHPRLQHGFARRRSVSTPSIASAPAFRRQPHGEATPLRQRRHGAGRRRRPVDAEDVEDRCSG